jgi:6-pyruvoyl-tetrahydropterin synthase
MQLECITPEDKNLFYQPVSLDQISAIGEMLNKANQYLADKIEEISGEKVNTQGNDIEVFKSLYDERRSLTANEYNQQLNQDLSSPIPVGDGKTIPSVRDSAKEIISTIIKIKRNLSNQEKFSLLETFKQKIENSLDSSLNHEIENPDKIYYSREELYTLIYSVLKEVINEDADWASKSQDVKNIIFENIISLFTKEVTINERVLSQIPDKFTTTTISQKPITSAIGGSLHRQGQIQTEYISDIDVPDGATLLDPQQYLSFE